MEFSSGFWCSSQHLWLLVLPSPPSRSGKLGVWPRAGGFGFRDRGGWASGPRAHRAHGRRSLSWPCRGFQCVGEQWLLRTQLRTWLDGPTSLSPGMWQGARSMMSPAALPPPALGSEDVWCIVSPTEHLWWGWGRAGRELSIRPRSPHEALTAATDPAGAFSDLPTEAIPIAKERERVTPRPGIDGGGCLPGAPRGSS